MTQQIAHGIQKRLDGFLRCSRYAFGPNRLHYCGPDKNQEIFSYIQEGKKDAGLKALLIQFKTMYPYLCHIAQSNRIDDPFDDRVVEAYWLGNELLGNIDKQAFYTYLIDDLKIKKNIGTKEFSYIEQKIGKGAVPHHSFHVLDIWRRTHGFEERAHTFESLDECRISWGKVTDVEGPYITVDTERIEYNNGNMFLSLPVQKKLIRKLESEYDIEQLQKGDYVSIHWGVICEKINETQFKNLKKYTVRHITLANQTL
ncbi:MAG: DUF6390 family protein [bacterium]